MVNKNLLKSKMALHGDTQEKLAEALYMGRLALWSRINGKVSFTAADISIITERYKLTNDEVCTIFGLGGE